MTTCANSAGLTVSWHDGTNLHEACFDRFAGEEMRTWLEASTVGFSATGSAIQGGSTRTSRYLWTVSAFTDATTAFQLENIFRMWDTERAAGNSSVVAIEDRTRVADINTPVTANCVFSTAPVITGATQGVPIYRVSFGLTEV